jgi:hypothetical protein
MSKFRFVAISAVALVTAFAARAQALDVSATKIQLKDNADDSKRQIQAQSKDALILYSGADSPGTLGASVHVYSADDDLCVILQEGVEWTDNGKIWKYKNKALGQQAQIGDGKLKIKLKGADFSLAASPQNTVNVQVQFGDTGTRYCMKCPGNTKDDTKQFLGKNCAAVACDVEDDPCNPNTTTTTTSTTTTTCPPSTPPLVEGALPATFGRFNYNLQLGLPGADAACVANFGTCRHACSITELQSAPTSELMGLKDTLANSVTSFWVIAADSRTNPSLTQCLDDVLGGSNRNWEYGTAHTASRGTAIPLNNGTGVLGAVGPNVQCNALPKNWVGCCQ